MAVPDPLDWLDAEADARRARGQERRLRVVPAGTELIPFAANDYLGLACDPRLAQAAHEAATRHGWGSGASPLVSGWHPPHQELVEALARFEGTESACLFATGYAANLGTLTALVGRGDAVYLDRLNHACLVDGARLSGASVRVYPHADADRLDAILKRERSRYRRVLIATDGVFSMDGDLAPLADLAAIAERHEAMLLVDEAHGTGVFGPTGRGASEACGVADRVHVRVGTLSKALGSVGGFVAGSQRLVEHLVNTARPLIYSTALPPAAAAAACEALRIARAEPWRRQRAQALGQHVRRALTDQGWTLVPSTGPIVPVLVGEPGPALALADRLREAGLHVPAIRPPTVPAGTARLRISLSAGQTDAQVERLLAVLAEVPRPGGEVAWPGRDRFAGMEHQADGSSDAGAPG